MRKSSNFQSIKKNMKNFEMRQALKSNDWAEVSVDLSHWPTRTLNFDYIIFIGKCGSPQPWLPNWKCTFNFSLAKWVFNMVSSKSNAIEIEHKVGMYKSNNSILSLFLPNYCRLSYIVFFFSFFGLKRQSICEWRSGKSRDSVEQQTLKLTFLWNSSWNDRQQT